MFVGQSGQPVITKFVALVDSGDGNTASTLGILGLERVYRVLLMKAKKAKNLELHTFTIIINNGRNSISA